MKVGSDNSIYSLLAHSSRKAPSLADAKMSSGQTQPLKTPAVRSNDDLVADFHARMAQQALDWADTDKNGKVTKSEFMDGQARLAELNGKPHDTAYSEAKWAKLDKSSNGWVSAKELDDGLKKLFPVQVGRLDSGYAERLRNRQG
ncbi:EF-hand domain-containing protein [Pararhizobium sp.]|uniref:EF-hand domain-containing protein n=1 Tax=Pararhizobium sp. TaxID=1977563 RepID=UPI003D144C14